jgi:hypothetical protein
LDAISNADYMSYKDLFPESDAEVKMEQLTSWIKEKGINNLPVVPMNSKSLTKVVFL